MKYLAIGFGGFVGANARYLVGGWVSDRWGHEFPWGTMVINITGSFILGFFSTLALRYAWSAQWRNVIAIGFVGAYTTFSTFEYETFQLAQNGALLRAAANAMGSLAAGFFAAWIGVRFAGLIVGR